MIEENKRRHINLNQPYNQFTGEGCNGERAQLVLSDAPFKLFLPVEMFKEKIVQDLQKSGSLYDAINGTELDISQLWIRLCDIRYEYDFEFYAISCVVIQDKLSGKDIPFKLNRGQRRLLKQLEDMRKRKVPIRIILLKARQWGGSTLIQIYMNWIQIIHRSNWSSVICAHTKDNSINIRSMYEKVITHLPDMDGKTIHIKNFAQTQNIKHVPERGCRITVGSAEEPDSVRSQDAKMAHFSEIGLYPNTEKKKTEDLVSSITGSIPRTPYTLIAYESTAKGVGDFFHAEWERAYAGKSVFKPVFVPWFMIDIYSEPFNGTYTGHDGDKYPGGEKELIETMTDYERSLFINNTDCTLENINWYRGKLSEMTSHALMKQEYPSDHIEAFQDSGMPVFRADDVESLRGECFLPEYIGEIEGDASPSSAKVDNTKRINILSNIKFISKPISLSKDPVTRENQTMNKLKAWILPDEEKLLYRWVVSVDTGGSSRKSDYSVITVIDRYWMKYGGVPEIAAEWRGHIDHDTLVWLAAQIATYYDNALLVFESNTHETERREGDPGEFIFDTISEYYSNLYSRIPADKIKEGVPAKWGFHTNSSSKTMIKDTFVSLLREKGYKERNEEALNEARWFEYKKNGSMGAIEGKHDDILMSRMIGLHICYELPLPKEITNDRPKVKKVIGVTSF
jgi:hypothetical protein